MLLIGKTILINKQVINEISRLRSGNLKIGFYKLSAIEVSFFMVSEKFNNITRLL